MNKINKAKNERKPLKKYYIAVPFKAARWC